MTDEHARRTNHKFSYPEKALIASGFIWLVVTAAIVYNGDVAYGLLYTGPALIMWSAAYALRGLSHAE